jgi:hypothetical protein
MPPCIETVVLLVGRRSVLPSTVKRSSTSAALRFIRQAAFATWTLCSSPSLPERPPEAGERTLALAGQWGFPLGRDRSPLNTLPYGLHGDAGELRSLVHRHPVTGWCQAPVLYDLTPHFVGNVTPSSHGLCLPTGCGAFARSESHMSRFPNLQPNVEALPVNQSKVRMSVPRDGLPLTG